MTATPGWSRPATMPAFKNPTFEERAALARDAKQKALEKFRAKPPVDEAVLEARRVAQAARDAAAAVKRQETAERNERRKEERQAKAVAAAEAAQAAAAAAAVAKPVKPELTDAEKKAIRDAKYAARKQRKK